jgi:hypothetical protein
MVRLRSVGTDEPRPVMAGTTELYDFAPGQGWLNDWLSRPSL